MVHAVTRFLAPGCGCLWCNRLIDPTELAVEMLPHHERDLARYVDEVPAPSVIALNNLAAAEAADHFMLAVTGLHTDDHDLGWILHRPRTRDRVLQHPRQDPGCRWCTPAGSLGRGDGWDPTRSSPEEDTQDPSGLASPSVGTQGCLA
jgi:hypothetical protein